MLCSSRIIPITVLSLFSNPLCYVEYLSVSEHSPVGSFIGVYSAVDVDDSILHYSIESNDFIAMNPLTGSLFIKGDIDYETTVNATYSFCILSNLESFSLFMLKNSSIPPIIVTLSSIFKSWIFQRNLSLIHPIIGVNQKRRMFYS